MKKISLKTQKILVFIPIINIIMLLVWLFIDFWKYPSKIKVKIQLYIILGCALLSRVISLIIELFKSSIIEYLILASSLQFYIVTVVASYIMIWIQEKYKEELFKVENTQRTASAFLKFNFGFLIKYYKIILPIALITVIILLIIWLISV